MTQTLGASGNVRIRVAKKSDLSSVVELRHKFDRHHKLPGLWPPEGGRRENLGRYRHMLHQRAARLFVAEQSYRGIVGYLTVSIQTRRCEDVDFRRVGMVTEVFVERTHRRRGIGKALVEAAVEFFSTRNIKHVTVRNAIENKLPNQFWQDLSFKPVLYTRTTTLVRLADALGKKRVRDPTSGGRHLCKSINKLGREPRHGRRADL